jgi:hypothetical protein
MAGHARERVRQEKGKCEGRKPHVELRPEAVILAKRLHRASPKTGKRMSLRKIAAALTEAGHLTKMAGAPLPQDRPIDGVDQTDFLLGKKETSNREGILLFCADRLEAIKWRNWKLALYDEELNWYTPPLKLGTPKLFNLVLDPKEEFPVTVQNTWAVEPMTKMIAAFELSMRKNPPIAPGTPDPYTPPK